jgi:methylated-DNA-[protein]-cysteine S-methyltransferase
MAYITTQLYSSPYGNLVLGAFDNKLCLCNWQNKKNKVAVNKRLLKHLNAEFIEGDSPVLKQTIAQLDDYFSNKRTTFELPLLMVGTDFQKQVWQTLLKIPYGHTISYQQLAQNIANEKAVRAAANANAANAISIIVPCHRIIGIHGNLVGYAGGLEAKQGLLKLEQTIS